MPEQAPTVAVTTERIMRAPYFAIGLADRRAGKPFDPTISSWEYERGRLFACLAPRDMPLKICGKLNPKAILLLDAAFERRLVI